MPTFTTIDEIKDLKLRPDDREFSKCGTISIEGNKFTATFKSDPKGAGVYLWVAKKGNSYEILYVGKAKDGPKSRLSQHKGGINKNTQTATARREQIGTCIASAGGSLEVFFRVSKIEPFIDVKASTYSLDEEALILRLNPVLNRSKPPKVGQNQSLINAIGEEFLSTRSDYSHAWEVCLSELSVSRRNLLEKSLKKFKKLVGDTNWHAFDFGVVGRYSNLPALNGRPVLVFGKRAKKKFSEKFALLALDEGSNDEKKADVLFFKKGQKVPICYSYKDFQDLKELPAGNKGPTCSGA
jgi:hypothetical protein